MTSTGQQGLKQGWTSDAAVTDSKRFLYRFLSCIQEFSSQTQRESVRRLTCWGSVPRGLVAWSLAFPWCWICLIRWKKIGFGLTLKWFYDQSYKIAVLAKNKCDCCTFTLVDTPVPFNTGTEVTLFYAEMLRFCVRHRIRRHGLLLGNLIFVLWIRTCMFNLLLTIFE